MIEDYIKEQPIAVTTLCNQLEKNKTLQAYIFCHNNLSYLRKFSKEFAKRLVCNEENPKIYKKIDNEEYDELKIIKPDKGIIKKEQILSLKKFILTRPVEGTKKVYIIENCENLNIVSANSMLKFVEEPEEDIVAIFLTQNLDLVLPTIKSRCQIISLNEHQNKEEFDFLSLDITSIEDYSEILLRITQVIKMIENDNINAYYKINKEFMKSFSEKEPFYLLINICLYVYYESFNFKILKHLKWIKDNNLTELIQQISTQNVEKIIKKIYVMEKINEDFNYNLNYKLLMDRIVIELCEV